MTYTTKIDYPESSRSGSESYDDQNATNTNYQSKIHSSQERSRYDSDQKTPRSYRNEDDSVFVPQKRDPEAEAIIERERSFQRKLRDIKGFVIKEMKSDGACLFRAVADQVYGDPEMHKLVRENCMDYMVRNEEFYSKFIAENFADYVKRKRHDRTYGDHVEIQALSEIYNRPIEVYQYSLEPINSFASKDTGATSPPIRLSYHGSIHYNSIIDLQRPTAGISFVSLGGKKVGASGDKSEDTKNCEDKKQDAIKAVGCSDAKEPVSNETLESTNWESIDEQLAHVTAWEFYSEWMGDKKLHESDATDCFKATNSNDKVVKPQRSYLQGSASMKRAQHGEERTGSSLSGSNQPRLSRKILHDPAGQQSERNEISDLELTLALKQCMESLD